MSVRHIILVTASILVLVALVFLFVEVRANPTIEIPEQALAQARARYTRSQAARPPTPPPLPARPAARPRPVRPATPERPERPELDTAEMEDRFAALREERAARAAEMQEEKQEAARARRDDIRDRRERVRQYYDQGDYENALSEAQELIPIAPTNRYVLRVAVTSACALEKSDVAAEQYSKLFRDEDRRIVRTRCARYGVEL